MDNRAIGVFDSGLGGLTAVKHLMDCLPEENIVYFGDTGRVPYGTRSPQTIVKYVMQDIGFLKTFDIKMIVAACGTASTVALDEVRKVTDIPLIGVLDAAPMRAAEATKNGRIGVIATNATVKSGAFEKKIKTILPDAQVYSKACPLFVPLVENGHFKTEVARLVAKEYLEELKQYDVDTLILGCTHYPLLREIIQEIMGDKVTLIDVGEAAAMTVKDYLGKNNMYAQEGKKPSYSYFVSDSVDNFAHLGSLFLQRQIGEMVNKIDIEKY